MNSRLLAVLAALALTAALPTPAVAAQNSQSPSNRSMVDHPHSRSRHKQGKHHKEKKPPKPTPPHNP